MAARFEFQALDAIPPPPGKLQRLPCPIAEDGSGEDAGDAAFVLRGFLSREECDAIIAQAEQVGFKDRIRHDYRSTDRVFLNAGPLEDLLFRRARPFLEDVVVPELGLPPRGVELGYAGRWRPVGLNTMFRACRYGPGGYFAPHHDGGYAEAGARSIKTFMIYLNDGFEGGATNFYHESQPHYSTPRRRKLLYTFIPQVGDCLVFNHHICHDGGRLASGRKYLLRTEVMYKHAGSVLDQQGVMLTPSVSCKSQEAEGVGARDEPGDDSKDSLCAVCNGSGLLLRSPCPLCCDDDEPCDSVAQAPKEKHRCEACNLDLQSAVSLAEHKLGRKHLRRAEGQARGHMAHLSKRSAMPPLSEEEFFERLAAGGYRSIVVCTGAGVSTEAGIADFRSRGGLFDEIRSRFGARFPSVQRSPEMLLSRSFAREHPGVWQEEVLPWLRTWRLVEALPAAAHRFCAWLHRQGWLRRIYTQNVDGLHTHPELRMAAGMVVECHGSFRDGSCVLYGDPMPDSVDETCRRDFGPESSPVDLVLVVGTSLQVAPFCAVPNLAKKGCARVLVNACLQDCLTNGFSRCGGPRVQDSIERSSRSCSLYDDCDDSMYRAQAQVSTARLGGWKAVTLRPLWRSREGDKRWRQLLIEARCSEFVERFFCSEAARARGFQLDDRALPV